MAQEAEPLDSERAQTEQLRDIAVAKVKAGSIDWASEARQLTRRLGELTREETLQHARGGLYD